MGDLFDAPVPPANRHDDDTAVGCVFDALRELANRRWAWKRSVEVFADNLLRTRCPDRRQELESIGRNVRHVRHGLERHPATGWTVLDDSGRLCLCREQERAAMMVLLNDEPPVGAYRNPGHGCAGVV